MRSCFRTVNNIKVSGNYFGDEDLHRRRGDLMR